MRHLSKGRKFNRKKGQRAAFLKSLENNLILKEKIQTTEARAKELRPKMEKLVTLGKKQNLAAMRLLISRLGKKSAQKIYYHIAPRYKDRKGGYTRIIKGAGLRKNDGVKKAIIEFV